MLARPAKTSRWRSRRLVAAIAVLLTTVGFVLHGGSGAALGASLCIGFVGVGAALLGRARWVRATRRTGVVMLGVAGAVALTVAIVTELNGLPVNTPGASPSDPPRSKQSSAGTRAGDGTTAGPDGIDPATGLLADASTEEVIANASPSSALAVLASLEVKGRAPRNDYARDEFGDPWSDIDRNGCDTRNDILARDLTDELLKPDTNNCVVLTGTLVDPYSGRVIQFHRGQDTSEAVQIDHVVALSDAWRKGAQGWTPSRRLAFANDPLNLLAVDGPLNMEKSDGDAATWLPPNRSYRCAYVARQVAVKASYDLWVTQSEKNAIATILEDCPAESLPTR